MKRVKVVVSGRVQGVFFRATCARMARERGLVGYVRNLPSGEVEAAFEGSDAAVDELVAWCRRGPELAQVSAIRAQDEAPLGDDGFRVAG